MTQDQIAELREMLAKATPGPWEARECRGYTHSDIYAASRPERPWIMCEGQGDDADVALAVAAVNTLPALLDRIERLEAGLRPFAQIACRYDPSPACHVNDNVELWQVGNNRGLRVDLTVGDLRRSRALLTKENPDARG